MKADTKIEFITSENEHWYPSQKKKETWYPSVTTVLSIWPKGVGFNRWLGNQESFDSSQQTLKAAGDRGIRVHNATQVLEEGGSLHRDAFSLEEWQMIMGFVNWHRKYNPEVIFVEKSVVSDAEQTGGTIDRLYRIDGQVILLDIKTSSAVHDQYWVQTGVYAHLLAVELKIMVDATAILRLAPRRKELFEYVLHDEWGKDALLFDNVYGIWKFLFPNAQPKFLELPLILSLNIQPKKKRGKKK